jgi:hypothetical protein
MIAGGATLFQEFPFTGTGGGGYFGCTRFATNSVGTAIDFCYLLDCENGFFGGLVDPCADPSAGAWLLDCPNGVGGGTNGGDDGTDDNDTDQNA